MPSLRCYLFRKDNLPDKMGKWMGGTFGTWLDARGSLKVRVDVGLGGEGQTTMEMCVGWRCASAAAGGGGGGSHIATPARTRYDGYKEKVSIGRFQKKLTQFGIRAVQDIFELYDGYVLVCAVVARSLAPAHVAWRTRAATWMARFRCLRSMPCKQLYGGESCHCTAPWSSSTRRGWRCAIHSIAMSLFCDFSGTPSSVAWQPCTG